MLGIIHKVNQERGFAFAEGEDKRDYFVYWQEVKRSSIAFRNLKEGMEIQFTPVENEDPKKAPKATEVIVTGKIVEIEKKPNKTRPVVVN